jgi:hypothetical protein
MPTIDLDALVSESKLPRVRLFGREVAVRPITGEGARKIAAAQGAKDNGEAMLAALLAVVRTSVPELTDAEVDRLVVEQVGAVVQIASGQVTDVEATIAEQAEKN